MNTLFEVEPEIPERADLPPIQGTEKQIPWAEGIRRKKLREIEQVLREWRLYIQRLADLGKEDQADFQRQKFRLALDQLAVIEQKTGANWWIARRENSARELLTDAEAKPGDSYSYAGERAQR